MTPEAEQSFHTFAQVSKEMAQEYSLEGGKQLLTYATGAGVGKGAAIAAEQLGAKAFLSKFFGVTSTRFANSACGVSGTWNRSGSFAKAGWSTVEKGGEWGYQLRIGLGRSATNTNIARVHINIPTTFVPNRTANSSLELKRWLFKAGE